jgi:hypothetical protein
VEIIAVPGGHPLLAIIDVFFGDVDPPCDDIGLADPVRASALRHGITESNDTGTGRHAIYGIDPAGDTGGGAIGENKTRRHGRKPARCAEN